jgi:hypothetical protein
VNASLSLYVRAAPETAYNFQHGARSEINLLGSQGGTTFEVRETPEQILALIEGAKP